MMKIINYKLRQIFVILFLMFKERIIDRTRGLYRVISEKNRSPIFHGTDRTREVNKLFIIWLQSFSSCGGHFAFNYDRFLVY